MEHYDILTSAASLPKPWVAKKARERAELFVDYYREPHLTVILESATHLPLLREILIVYESDKYVESMRRQSFQVPLNIFLNLSTAEEVKLYFDSEMAKKIEKHDEERRLAIIKEEKALLRTLILKYPSLAKSVIAMEVDA